MVPGEGFTLRVRGRLRLDEWWERDYGLYFFPHHRTRLDENHCRDDSWIRHNGAAGRGLRQCVATQRNLGWVDRQPIHFRCHNRVRQSAEQLLRGDQWQRGTGGATKTNGTGTPSGVKQERGPT